MNCITKNKISLLSIFLSFIITSKCLGQNVACELKGTICDKNNQETLLDNVEVIISTVERNNENYAKSCYTKNDGRYSLTATPGKYCILFRNYGKILYQDTLLITQDMDMGVVPITIDAKILPEVNVKGHRKTISYDRDRIVYNVKLSPWAKGFNAKDVITNMPWIDPTKPNELSLVGKDGVILLVNERRIALKGKELTIFLQNIASADIERIEIMTNPSPEFSAEGNNGVINIVTKQNRNIGFEGSVSTEYTQRRKPTFSEYANLVFSNRLLLINYGISNYNENAYNEILTNYSYPTYTRISSAKTDLKYDGVSQNLSANFFLNNNMNIGFMGALAFTKNGFDKKSVVEYTNLSIPQVDEFTHRDGKFHSITFTPYYEWNIDSLGKKLVVNYSYSKSHDKGHQTYISETKLPFTESRINGLYIYSSYNVDLKLPYTWMNFEAGSEYRHYKANNSSEYSVTEDYLYKESVFSTYADVNKTWGNWYAKVGARYEYTTQNGCLGNGQTAFKKKYGNLFPFVDITFHPIETSTLVLGYSKRIQRPPMYCLDPTRGYTDSYHYENGDPQMRPTLMDYLELKYMVNNLYVELSYIYTKDGITQVFSDNGNGIVGSCYTNGLTIQSFGGNINYTNNKNKFSANIAGSLYYNRAEVNLSDLDDDNLKGLTSRISSTLTYKFMDNCTLFARYYYVFPGLSENVHFESFQSLSLGVNMQLLRGKLNFEIGTSDIFKTLKSRNKIDYKTFTFTNKINNDVRSVYLKMSFHFGNDKVRHNNVDVNSGDGRIPTSRL